MSQNGPPNFQTQQFYVKLSSYFRSFVRNGCKGRSSGQRHAGQKTSSGCDQPSRTITSRPLQSASNPQEPPAGLGSRRPLCICSLTTSLLIEHTDPPSVCSIEQTPPEALCPTFAPTEVQSVAKLTGPSKKSMCRDSLTFPSCRILSNLPTIRLLTLVPSTVPSSSVEACIRNCIECRFATQLLSPQPGWHD